MGLYARLTGVGLPDDQGKLPITQFGAAIRELARGKITRAQLITEFGLSVEEETDLDWLITRASTMTAIEQLEFTEVIFDVLALAEHGSTIYNTEQSVIDRIQEE